ncbi:MAG: ABC transporter ATP-binding protein/permease [Alphaproteobacteria bacterium]|nr:ABC transporter ATP-binding protein/permease [Alphaproteobacteria bacterium]
MSTTPFAFIISVLKPFRMMIFGMLSCSFIYAIDISIRPYLTKVIVNSVKDAAPESILSVAMVPVTLYIVMSIIMVIAFRIHDYLWLKFNPSVKRHLGLVLMERMLEHSHAFYQDHFAGSLANKIKDAMSGIPDCVSHTILHFFPHIIGIPVAMLTLYYVQPTLALSLFVWSGFFICSAIFFSKRGVPYTDASAEARSVVVGSLVDILGNMMSVRLFANREGETRYLTQSLNEYVRQDQRRDWFFLKVFAIQGSSFVIYQGICLFLLLKGYGQGRVTAGDFALVFTLNISIIDRLWNLLQHIRQLTHLVGEITQGLRLVLSPPEIMDAPDAPLLTVTEGRIIFDRVGFHYKGVDPLFQDKSIIIEPGQRVGLVGKSGGGKSTFVNLILRLYDVTQGRILIDGQDIKDVTQDSLHKAIAMIPQDPSLFHRSLMDNIRYGKYNATDDDVMNAAKRAHAHGFISKLPRGYESLVGERGVKLSGGQRQRIAIARAILKNAPILMLDEATSQLDSVTEAAIQESLLSLMEGKTTLVIAHRLSTLLHMDRILVFDKGRIVEDGTHADLLAKGGLYTTLWNAQIGGFLGDGFFGSSESKVK